MEKDEMVELLKDVLPKVEWQSDSRGGTLCPICHAEQYMTKHFYGCKLKRLLEIIGEGWYDKRINQSRVER